MYIHMDHTIYAAYHFSFPIPFQKFQQCVKGTSLYLSILSGLQKHDFIASKYFIKILTVFYLHIYLLLNLTF